VDALDGFAQQRRHGENLRLRQKLIFAQRDRIKPEDA
jgi:hypothetical protein